MDLDTIRVYGQDFVPSMHALPLLQACQGAYTPILNASRLECPSEHATSLSIHVDSFIYLVKSKTWLHMRHYWWLKSLEHCIHCQYTIHCSYNPLRNLATSGWGPGLLEGETC